jgi:hypothetical protein
VANALWRKGLDSISTTQRTAETSSFRPRRFREARLFKRFRLGQRTRFASGMGRGCWVASRAASSGAPLVCERACLPVAPDGNSEQQRLLLQCAQRPIVFASWRSILVGGRRAT